MLIPTPGGAATATVDAFAQWFYDGLASAVYAEPVPLDRSSTALVLIDVQESITRDALLATLADLDVEIAPLLPVLDQIEQNLRTTATNISRVLKKVRQKGIRPIHVRIQSYAHDAADTGALHRSAGMFHPPGSRGASFLPEAGPLDGEIVLNKTCSGIHVGTQIDQVLRNLGITTVIIVGFYTDQCISTSVRDLADLGYVVDLIDDAVGALSPQRQEYALQSIRKMYANSEDTASLLARLDRL